MKLHLPHITVAPNIWQAAAIVVLIFILVLVLAYMSRSFMSWSLSGAGIGLIVGFALALILEGFLLISGKTVLTSLMGARNAPKPIQTILDNGHKNLLEVLNVPKSCWPETK